MRKQLRLTVLIFGQLLLLAGCLPQEIREDFVLTEDVIYISGDKVRLTGRVVVANGDITDHGFYLSENEDFTSPTTISLGAKENGLGRFIADYSGLKIGTQYYYKSYAIIGGKEITGKTEQFASLQPAIKYFTPAFGDGGTKVTIVGNNFTEGTQVFFGDTEASIESLNDESVIVAIAPPLGANPDVTIRVVVQDTSMTFADIYQYPYGVWQLETTFIDNTQLYETAFLRINNEFVFGLGKEYGSFDLNLKMWSLDLTNYSWTQLNFPGFQGTTSPFVTATYWGAGKEETTFSGSSFSPYFWQYQGNDTFELLPFLPFRLYKATAHETNDYIYIIGGLLPGGNDNYNPIVYRYDKSSKSWIVSGSFTPESTMPISSDLPYFTYNNNAYFVMPIVGQQGGYEIWQYDLETNDFNFFNELPFSGTLDGGIAIVKNDKVYIGLFTNYIDLYELDLLTGSWTVKKGFAGSSKDVNIGYFTYNDKIFVMRSKYQGGRFDPDPKMELWSFDPDKIK